MPRIRELIDHLDRLLEADEFKDYGPNGLQVPGSEEIHTVVTGVSANGPLIDAAVEAGADLVLVHHGLYWRGDPQQITPLLHRRLKPLFAHDIGLAAYHLPLDAHLEHGNNALLAQRLGGVNPRRFAGIGVAVDFQQPLTIDALTLKVRDAVDGREPLVVPAGPELINNIGIVSGAATDDVLTALDAGLDAFLTGEPAERGYSIATDSGIHFIAAGHHATETLGVRRLGDLLAREFGVRHIYVDVPNPI